MTLKVLLLFFVFINSCSTKQKNSYFLEESTDNILMNINNIDIKKDFLLISDDKSGNLYIYNTHNGKLIKTIKPSIFFSDSLAIKIRNTNSKNPKKYVTLKELYKYKGGEYDPDKLKKWIHNKFVLSFFQNDTTLLSIMSCSINSVQKDKRFPTGWGWGMGTIGALSEYNFINDKVIINPLMTKYVSGNINYTPYISLFKQNPINSKILVSMLLSDTDSFLKKNDIKYLTAYYNKKGEFSSFYTIIPYYYKNLNDDISLGEPKATFSRTENKFIFVFPFIPSLFIKNKEVRLKNFPSQYNVLIKYKDSNNFETKIRKLINNHKPITDFNILDIFIYKKNIMLYIKKNTEEKTKILLIEYDLNGNKISEYQVKLTNRDISIPHIFYKEELNKFIIIRKYKKGWYVKWINKPENFNL